MATRFKAQTRRERESGSMESFKPFVVLILFGTILYGAYCVVQKGDHAGGQPWQLLVAGITGTTTQSTATEAPAFAAPQVDHQSFMPAPVVQATSAPVIAPTATPSLPIAGGPPAVAAFAPVEPPPIYLNAQSASPPVASTVAPPSTPASPPPAMLEAEALSTAQMVPPSTIPQRSSAFASAWADAHDKLATGCYAEALAVLSAWHDDTSLGLEESQRLEELLGQLAGTVIYSQQDLLLPPHIVGPGETLPAIAAPLTVPWQLLAKINGVTDPNALIPGEPLKVVRGPFDAVVSVSLRRLSLQVGGNYAGSFPIGVGRQIQERIGSSLPVVDVQRGSASSEPPGPIAQVSYLSRGTKSIGLGNGMTVEAVNDPTALSDGVPTSSLVISARDLDEIIDILGPGSHVLIRQ